MPIRKCKMCKAPFEGRSDKIFCSANCKAIYHVKLKKVTNEATDLIDKILHRNRSTLLEIMGKSATSKKIDKKLLDAKKFNWTYITHYHINKQGKTVHYVFDFSYIVFSDQEVLIKRIL
jgi:predicted nucleic acid-binding Zn ribbon protein